MKRAEGEFRYRAEQKTLHHPGVQKVSDGVCFTIAVPEEKECCLLFYRKGEEEAIASVPVEYAPGLGDVRSVVVQAPDMEQYGYNYLIDGEVVTDPYASCLGGREAFGQRTGQMMYGRICLQEYNWEKDEPLHLPQQELVVYAAHVRGFTMDASSGVKHPGTFLGIQEKIGYLKKLGITSLELMPVYDFVEILSMPGGQGAVYGSMAEREAPLHYWGYSEGYYFAPKSSYSASGNPVEEFKNLVKALHRNGIEVILEFYFPKGTKSTLIQDCIRYWALEYHIDGVHVNRDGTPVEILAQDPLLSHTRIWTESFHLEEIYPKRYEPVYRNLAEYHDGFLVAARRFLKGDEGCLMDFVWRARRNPSACGVINYLANHNGFTLLDAVSYEEKHNEANGEENRDGTNYNYTWNCGQEGVSRRRNVQKLRRQQLRNAYVLLLLSQGIPLIYQGDERGNSQMGNNNAYCQDNELSWVNWRAGTAQKQLYEYVKALIAFRRSHPVFHQKGELKGSDYISCGYPDISYHGKRAWFGELEQGGRAVGILYAGAYAALTDADGEQDASFYVAYNMYGTEHEFALPGLCGKEKWRVAIDTSKEGNAGIYPAGGEAEIEGQRIITVPGHTIMVLIGK